MLKPSDSKHSDEGTAFARCSRCGLPDGRHIGYHDAHELPIKRGQRVRVRAGAILHATLPRPSKRTMVNKRSRVVTALSIHHGLSAHVGYDDNMKSLWHPIDEPQVCWPGAGGYWHYANMSDCAGVP